MAHRGTEFLIHHWTASFNPANFEVSNRVHHDRSIVQGRQLSVAATERKEQPPPLPFCLCWHTLFTNMNEDMLHRGPVSGLLTDLYELTMAAGYVQNRFDATATFELFVRHLPHRRNYLVAAGLEQALDFLENVRFFDDDISYLRLLPAFKHVRSEFFDYLSRFRFHGDVWALPEGTIFFPGEPLLRVTAPIADAQLVETSLLSILHFQTLIASKASRVTTAASGRPVVEFGSRRAHGVEAGVLAARA